MVAALGSPRQDARHPISSITKGYTVGSLSFSLVRDSVQVTCAFCTGLANIKKTDPPRAGAAVEREDAYRPVDRPSGERQTATLGDGAARPTEAEHVRTC